MQPKEECIKSAEEDCLIDQKEYEKYKQQKTKKKKKKKTTNKPENKNGKKNNSMDISRDKQVKSHK